VPLLWLSLNFQELAKLAVLVYTFIFSAVGKWSAAMIQMQTVLDVADNPL
jgi:uncharacterized protein involved in tellurium resistance